MRKASPTASRPDVVLIGATTLLGAEVRRELAERRFPLRDLTMMGEGEEVGAVVDYDGEARLVTELDSERLARADLLFVGSRGQTARRAVTAFCEGEGVVIDLVDAVAAGSDPVVNMDVNATGLPAGGPVRVRSPHAVVQILSSVLATVSEASPVVDVSATVLTPVSDKGEPAVDELYRQTAAVLNFQDKPQSVFERQVAFNAVPHALMHAQQGWPDLDSRLALETSAVMDLPVANISIRAVLVSVFHGLSLLVSVRTGRPLNRAARKELLSGQSFKIGPITAAELEGSDAVHVTDLGDEPGGRFGLWIVADNLKQCGAANSVRIAEALVASAAVKSGKAGGGKARGSKRKGSGPR